MSSNPPSRWPTVLTALLVGAGIGAAVLWFVQRDDLDTETTSTAAASTTTTLIAESRDLRSFDEWAGVLQSGTTAGVSASARGTVTRNSEVGDRIELGQTIAEIDGSPVVALYGSVPQFRELDADVDDGADIRQLEENLVALGYDPDGTVTVDDDYTVNTGLMVERWEVDIGLEEPDTTVAAGQVAFIAGPSEVLSRTAVGSQVTPGQILLTTITLAESGYLGLPLNAQSLEDVLLVEGTTLTDGVNLATLQIDGEPLLVTGRSDDADVDTDAGEVPIRIDATIAEITADVTNPVEAGRPIYRWEAPQGSIELEVDVDETDNFPVGLAVDVELPDGQLVAAEVVSVDDVARTIQVGQEAVTVVDVSVQPLEPIDSAFTTGPVTIRVEDDAVLGATVVPVRALVALAEGGHAVEIDGRGLVAVELGSFDDGWVEITNGAVSPGDTLVVTT